MIPRTAADILREFSRGYPALALTGPRQSGKTTLARALFDDRPYVSLEDPEEREFAEEDPRGFLDRFRSGAVFDEIQRVPGLFSYLQGTLDASKKMGRFLLTGSQQFGLVSGITQTLAGRIALVELLPFSLAELTAAGKAPTDLDTLLFQGLYPPIYDRKLAPGSWYANYVRTYVERDVRQLLNVRDLAAFQRFLRLCAGRCGQLVSYSGLAADAGITHNTARSWLTILEASYILFFLQPHHRNFNKRLTKSPKLYFHDVGLAAYLLGLRDPAQLALHPLRGALFENWVVSELLKHRLHRGLSSDLYFWRDRSGTEVDLVIEQETKLMPVEIKSGKTITADQLKGLRKWIGIAGEVAADGWLVYGGNTKAVRGGIHIVPWAKTGGILG